MALELKQLENKPWYWGLAIGGIVGGVLYLLANFYWPNFTEMKRIIEQRIGRPAIEGHRQLPDGSVLIWHQLGVKDLQVDAQLPFFVKWSRDAIHPSAGGRQVELLKIEIAGDQERVDGWLGGRSKEILADVDIDWCPPRDRSGLAAAIFSTPRGEVRI